MKRTRSNIDVFYLSEEIVRNILKRLPVKSLLRFQCVCKLWKNLIKNPSFIAQHLQHSSRQTPSLLLEFDSSIPSLFCVLDCDLEVREVPKAPLIDSLESATIVGSCNGLLLFETRENKNLPPPLLLWNPATASVGHVPMTTTDCSEFGDYRTGFGFSPIVNDYVIVRTYAKLGDSVSRVEVFSFSRWSWKGTDVGNLKGVGLFSESVTVGGAIFWTGLKFGADEGGEDDVGVIVSFDIVKEVFTLIPMPNFDYKTEGSPTVYDNKLAILYDIWENVVIELWVLDDGSCVSGKTWSWTKRYAGSPFTDALQTLTVWRNEIVSKPYGENVLYLVNLTTNDVTRKMVRTPEENVQEQVESAREEIGTETTNDEDQNNDEQNEEVTRPRKKRRDSSNVWSHFTRMPIRETGGKPRAKCNYCPKNYASHPSNDGIASLWRHYSKCKGNPNRDTEGQFVGSFFQ